MATTLTNADTQVLAQLSLNALLEKLGPITAFSTQFDSEGARKGDIVKVATYGAMPAAAAFNRSSNNYESDDAVSVTYVDVTLSEHLISTFKLDDEQSEKVDVELMSMNAGHAVAKQALINAYGLITNANFGAAVFTGAAGTFDSDEVADLWQAAVDANFGDDRVLQLTPAYIVSLLKDADIKNAEKSDSDAALRDGAVGPLYEFDVQTSQVLPANGENLVGFITDKSGIAVAMAPPPVPAGNAAMIVDSAVATDPETGITIQVRQHYNPGPGEVYINYETLFGKSVGQSNGLKRLVSA